MQPVVFSLVWFARHQRALLALLNAPVIGGELRDALGIRRHDLGGDQHRRIVRLLPHAYIVANPDGSCTLDVRTHAKYAKRLRHQCAPLWRAAHAWDRFIANPLVPALNLGFDTLTVYPDPGSPGTTTCDGWARRRPVDETFATIRAGAGLENGVGDAQAQFAYLVASAITNQYQWLARSFFLFDTSSLGAAAIVSAATFSLFGSASAAALGASQMDVAGGTPASNTTIAAADYGNVQRTSFGSVSSAAFSTSAYNDLALNANGLANVSLTGISKFSTQGHWDLANSFGGTWASGAEDKYQGFYADQTGSANDPKLAITFSLVFPGVYAQELSGGGVVGQTWG